MRRVFGILAGFSLASGVFLFQGCPSSPTGRLELDLFGEIPDMVEPSDQADGFSGFAVCDPCVTSQDCSDSLCVALEGGNFCLKECVLMGCDEGFQCVDTADGPLCLPTGGVCTCTAAQDGMEKVCVKNSEFGQCPGTATCFPDKGWSCNAPAPSQELCDAVDNDCDGKTDEDFMLGEWIFGQDNCGECGKSCTDAVENGTGFCSLVPPPTCKVSACDPGYYSPDGLACKLQQSAACVPCTANEECPGGACLAVGPETFCLPLCGDACPTGYSCAAVDQGDFCVPQSGSCDCTPESVGMVRTCQTSNEFGTCVGGQACTDAGWSPCDAQVPAAETCNGIDDNCSGVADEELSGVTPCVSSVPGVGTCPGFFECTGEQGLVCNAPLPSPEICDYKDNDCNNVLDDPFVDPATGLYLDDKNCAVCGNDCTLITFPNAYAVCTLIEALPACGMECLEKWVDLNKDVADGCECPFLSQDDPPDGIDQNCDGIDGDPDNAIFVSIVGSDLYPGTPELPVRNISKGIERCLETGKEHVYVAQGAYSERISLVEGVRIFGGFAADFSVRKVADYPTSVEGKVTPLPGLPQAAVSGTGVGAGPKTTSFEGFTVYGPYVVEPGRSSYALHLLDCGQFLVIQDNALVGGTAGNGVDGDDGFDGIDGQPGASGQAALDIGSDKCNNLSSKGGPAASGSCDGQDVSGGAGGDSVCPDYNELGPSGMCPVDEQQNPLSKEYGGNGFPFGAGGNGGEPGRDATQTQMFDGKKCDNDPMNCNYCHISLWGTEGKNGWGGTGGANGAGGTGCTAAGGGLSAGEWTASPGTPGAAGKAGAGGGGGGAGGGVETYGCFDYIGGADLGASGGGGGSGGCSGTGGSGGTGGGGAFGLFMAWTQAATSAPTLANVTTATGTAGSGGDGGKAGVGGSGGWGGPGGMSGAGDQTLWCAGEGGWGGNGGNGGSGGGGGGGCGGVSFGVYVDVTHAPPAVLQSVKAAVTASLVGSGGAGGVGGSSKGLFGSSGGQGAHAEFNF